MTLPNKASYERAAGMIRDGKWTVDPEAGLVWSSKMKRPLSQWKKDRYHVIMLANLDRPGAFQVSLHRVIWEYVHGPIPDGMEVNHKDGNTSNNSISNLELLTHVGNIRHAIDTGLRIDHHIGAPGESNHMAVLTEADVREIRELLAQGLTQKVIAARFGICQPLVSHIKTGKSWAHVA